MNKRLFVMWCLVLSLLCGCGSTPAADEVNFRTYQKDNRWYMEFLSPVEDESFETSENASIAVSYPCFDHVSDMQKMLKSGKIPEGYVEVLSNFGKEKTIEICNPNKLYDLTLPNSLIYDNVVWYGDYYSFEFVQEDFIGYIYCVNQEQYNRKLNEVYVGFPNENHTVFNDDMVEERNARVVHSVTNSCQLKTILYKLTLEEYEIYIVEEYYIKWFAGKQPNGRFGRESESAPAKVSILGNDGHNYWFGWFMGFEERPSVEWLSSFRLTPIE